MRVLLTAAAFLISSAVLAPALFFAAIVLAGPHSSMLPSSVQPIVVIAAWITLLAAPIVIARAVWRRQAPQPR